MIRLDLQGRCQISDSLGMKASQFSFSTQWIAITAATTLVTLQGCSLIFPRSDSQAVDPSFHATATSNDLPVVLPVEIADNIQAIARGEQVPNAGWEKESLPDETSVNAKDPDASSKTAADEVAGEVSSKKSTKQSLNERTPASELGPRVFKKMGGHREYKTKRGDTLMKIAFEAFGNVYRWREIYETNKPKINDFNAVPVGTVLTINGVEYVKIVRNGSPYLIRRADTLTKISKDLYGQPRHWKSLWKNNEQLIHDPNKIYAGFTLYYLKNPEK
jgi:LysM domain